MSDLHFYLEGNNRSGDETGSLDRIDYAIIANRKIDSEFSGLVIPELFVQKQLILKSLYLLIGNNFFRSLLIYYILINIFFKILLFF